MPSDSSEESECWEYVGEEVAFAEGDPDPAEDCWENVEQVALAEEEAVPACCLVVPCPPFQSTNTAQRKPAGFLAGTAALANQFDGVEYPAQLFDEAVDPCAETAGGDDCAVCAKVPSAEDATGGMVGTSDGVVAGVVGGAGASGSGGWTRPERIFGRRARPGGLAGRAGTMLTSASSAVDVSSVSVEVRIHA